MATTKQRTTKHQKSGIPRRMSQRWFELRRSGIQGRGGFAVRTIPKGTRIIEYTGERIDQAEADRRYPDEEMGRHHTFLFAIDDDIVVDAAVDGNEARFINHSCDPNCDAVIEDERIFIESLRRIEPGEELLYDYQYEIGGPHDAAAKALYFCKCGSEKCRGTILKPKSKKGKAKGKEPKGKGKEPKAKAKAPNVKAKGNGLNGRTKKRARPRG